MHTTTWQLKMKLFFVKVLVRSFSSKNLGELSFFYVLHSHIHFTSSAGHCAVGSIVGASNAKVASLLGAGMVLVANGGLVSYKSNIISFVKST